MIVIDVLGTPAPKGSARAFIAGGRAVVAPSGSKVNQARLKSWDVSVRESALEVIGERAEPVYVAVAVAVELTFRIARPGGHWSKKPSGGLLPSAPKTPTVKPDADKLARATLDSLAGIAFDDDSRIVELMVRKVYAEPGREGARIVVREAVP